MPDSRFQKETESFKKLLVWQKAYLLTLEIYKLTQTFPSHELYGLVSQMRRAVVSIAANIAEGQERQHKREFLQFLMIAKGSLGETETYLLLAKDLKYIRDEAYTKVDSQQKEIGKMLHGLIKAIKTL